MAVEIVTVPDLGGAETVDVIELSIAQGDAVALEDSLLVLESDKATMDVPSPFAGTLVKFLVADGDTVKVGDPIAEIEVAGQQAEASAEPAKAAAAVIEEQPEPVKQPEAATVSAEQAGGLAEQLILVPDIGSEDQIDVIEISVAIGDQVEEGDADADNLVFFGDEDYLEPDPDDDAFVAEFENMMAAESKKVRPDAASVGKLDVAIPLHLKGSSTQNLEAVQGGRDQCNDGEGELLHLSLVK